MYNLQISTPLTFHPSSHPFRRRSTVPRYLPDPFCSGSSRLSVCRRFARPSVCQHFSTVSQHFSMVYQRRFATVSSASFRFWVCQIARSFHRCCSANFAFRPWISLLSHDSEKNTRSGERKADPEVTCESPRNTSCTPGCNVPPSPAPPLRSHLK